MSTAEVFGRDSVARLIYHCVSTASSLFYETQVIVIYLVRRQHYWMAAESDLSSPLAGCHGCTNKKADQATEGLRKLKLVRELKWRWRRGRSWRGRTQFPNRKDWNRTFARLKYILGENLCLWSGPSILRYLLKEKAICLTDNKNLRDVT